MPGLVAVTGATGFIGQALLSALKRENWQVRALTRLPRVGDEQTTWITGTLHDSDALHQLVNGAFAVIHCAGKVSGADLDEFLHTNVQGTVNLVTAAKQQYPLPRFLLISSLAAREPQLSWYAESKYRAELRLQELAGNMNWTAFRPTAVYGPGDKQLTPLLAVTRFGVLPVTVSTASRFGLLYVDDLVSASIGWLNAEQPVVGVYELDDGTPGGYDHQTVATIAGQVWQRRVYTFRLPAILIRYLARINLLLARLFHYSPMLTPAKVRELFHPDWVCNNTPLTRVLGWKPVTDLRKGMPRALLPFSNDAQQEIDI